MRYRPYDYQQFAEDFILDRTASGLLLDMGMGKTVITLTALDKLIDLMETEKTLIVAPLRPARETWPQELAKWDHLKDRTCSLVLGTKEQRERALAAEADFYVINRENVPWLVEKYKAGWPFDTVVLDELSSFKSSRSQRFRELRKVRKYIRRIIGLTGTPASNGLLDLWPEMYLLDQGKALGRTLTGFRDQYFLPDKRNGPVIYSWKPKKGAEEEIYEKIRPLCMSMKSEDYLTLPETMYIRHEIDLPKDARKIYEKMETEMLLPYADGDIDAPTAAVLAGKLMQLAGGAAYDEHGKPRIIHRAKLDAFDDLYEAANGQPVLVYYGYRHERDRIMERHPEAVDIKEKDAVQRWNRGEIQLLLAHPASAGHGLNLQEGGHIIIWYGLPMSLELYQQANKRLPRPGQKSAVLIHLLLVKDTFDMDAADRILTSKEKIQNEILEAVKARIR